MSSKPKKVKQNYRQWKKDKKNSIRYIETVYNTFLILYEVQLSCAIREVSPSTSFPIKKFTVT